MNTEIHPSRRTIMFKTTPHRVAVLPLKARVVEISTTAFNRIYGTWDGTAKTNKAGDFAQALRELRIHEEILHELPGVSALAATLCYDWLEQYEVAVAQYAIQQKQAAKKKLELARKPAALESDATLEDRFAMAALQSASMESSDPTTTALKAYAIAKAMMDVRSGRIVAPATDSNIWAD